jgi:hypothetical protein
LLCRQYRRQANTFVAQGAAVIARFLQAVLLSATIAAPSAPAPVTSTILNATEAAKILPATVFFQGQSAPIQARNSAGVRFSKDAVMLAAVVDNSGYSSAIAERYQAYLITETALDFETHTLPPGAYGFGFIASDSFVIMDIGGHAIFTAHTTKDAALRRPNPLQILPDGDKSGSYRLYIGRSFIAFTQSSH